MGTVFFLVGPARCLHRTAVRLSRLSSWSRRSRRRRKSFRWWPRWWEWPLYHHRLVRTPGPSQHPACRLPVTVNTVLHVYFTHTCTSNSFHVHVHVHLFFQVREGTMWSKLYSVTHPQPVKRDVEYSISNNPTVNTNEDDRPLSQSLQEVQLRFVALWWRQRRNFRRVRLYWPRHLVILLWHNHGLSGFYTDTCWVAIIGGRSNIVFCLLCVNHVRVLILTELHHSLHDQSRLCQARIQTAKPAGENNYIHVRDISKNK